MPYSSLLTVSSVFRRRRFWVMLQSSYTIIPQANGHSDAGPDHVRAFVSRYGGILQEQDVLTTESINNVTCCWRSRRRLTAHDVQVTVKRSNHDDVKP